ERHGLAPRTVLTPSRVSVVVHHPDRLDQGVHGDRVRGVFLGQLQESQREVVAEPVHASDDLLSFLVGPGSPARGSLVFLEKRVVLLRGRGRLVLVFVLTRQQSGGQEQGEEKQSETAGPW